MSLSAGRNVCAARLVAVLINHVKDSNKVYGVSNCHVLCKNTTVDYKNKGGALGL